MYIRFYPYKIYFKVVSISCFCIYTSFGENSFSFQNSSFEKYGFCLRPNILYHKNSSNSMSHIFVMSNILQELIFMKFIGFYRILLELKYTKF